MEYHRLQIKRIARKTIALSRRPRMWFVTVTFLLLCALVTGLFGLVAPNPFENMREPISEALRTTEKYAAETGDVQHIVPEFWRTLTRELNDTLPGNKKTSVLLRLLSDSMPALLIAGLLMGVAGLVNVVLDHGYRACCLSVFRRRGTSLKALFDPFPRILTVLGTYFMVGVFCFLWVASGIVIGVAAISLVSMTLEGVEAVLVGTIAGLAVFTVVHTLCLQYALTPFIIADYPDASIFEVIEYSKRLMEGNRLRFLALEVSFLGWYLLIAAIAGAILAVGGIAASLIVAVFRLPLWAGVLFAITVVMAVIVPIPIAVWLLGFRKTAFAGFYHILSYVPEEEDEEEEKSGEETGADTEGEVAETGAEPAEKEEISEETAALTAEETPEETPAEEEITEEPAEEITEGPAAEEPAPETAEVPQDLPEEEIPKNAGEEEGKTEETPEIDPVPEEEEKIEV